MLHFLLPVAPIAPIAALPPLIAFAVVPLMPVVMPNGDGVEIACQVIACQVNANGEVDGLANGHFMGKSAWIVLII